MWRIACAAATCCLTLVAAGIAKIDEVVGVSCVLANFLELR